MSKENRISRRVFIKDAAIGAAAASAAAFAGIAPTVAHAQPGAAPNIPAKWDYEADVIVVGTGPAGMACAAAAAENKASVIVVEMNDKVGGKGILAGGNLGIGGGTRMQIEQGFEENADMIYQDRTEFSLRTDAKMKVEDVEGGVHEIGQWRRISGAEDAEGLSRVFADRSLDTWNWLDKLGAPFIKANVSSMSAVYRGSRYYTTTKATPVNREGKDTDMQAGGAGLIWPMYDHAVKNGAKFFLSHKMTRIIREGDRSGRVLGIEVKAGDKTLYFKGNKAVFLGTGSWNGNKKLKVLFSPWLIKYPHVSGEPYVFNDGSGMQAGIEAGASLTTDRGSDWHGWHRHPGTHWHSIDMPYGLPGTEEPDPATSIFVNALGKRFMNETIGEDNPAWVGGNPPFYFAQLASLQPTNEHGPIVWIVMDEDARVKQEMEFKVGEIVDEKMYATGATIAELAAKMNVPADALTESVTKYNALVASGKDTDFGKKEMAAKIEKPPFHALLWGIQKHNTLGGLTHNEKAQVLDWDRNVIPGLYAAGEVAGGMDLIGLARPILFGRVAGEWAAKEPALG